MKIHFDGLKQKQIDDVDKEMTVSVKQCLTNRLVDQMV